MSDTDHYGFATGRALLIDARVDATKLHEGSGSVWSRGPSRFKVRDIEKNRHITNTLIGEKERRSNFGPLTAKLLYGSEDEQGRIVSQDQNSNTPLRWHLSGGDSAEDLRQKLTDVLHKVQMQDEGGKDENRVGGLKQHKVVGADLIIAARHATPKLNGESRSGKDTVRRACLILHLGYRDSEREGDLRGEPLSGEIANNLQQRFREAQAREAYLTALESHLSELQVLSLSSEQPGGDNTTRSGEEDYGAVYPVFTDLGLHLQDDHEDGRLTLLIREIATATPSVVHGSVTPKDRARRIRDTRDPKQYLRISDQWGFLPTRHGGVFFGLQEGAPRRSPASRLYVSAAYLDYLALTRLEAGLLRDFRMQLVSNVQGAEGLDLHDVLAVRHRLMGLRGSYAKVGIGESNTAQSLSHAMREVVLKTPQLLDDITEEAEDLSEVADIKYQVDAQYRSKLLTGALAVLTIIGVPISLFGTGISAGAAGDDVLVSYLVVAGVLVIAAVVAIAAIFKRWTKKKPPK